MKGLELAERYYRECGAPMLHEQFPELEGVIAVGLVGSGSECFGYDDEISRDHDFEPGFCLFLPEEDRVDRRAAFRLERAYAKLPDEFCGFARQKVGPVGGGRHGVIRAGDFYLSKTGRRNGFTGLRDWFTVPDLYLAEATNGKVFRDDDGAFSAVRRSLTEMPDDVRRKKLAGRLLLMEQAGQYNFPRCAAHGETGAAQLAAVEFAESAMAAAFLLEKRYMPFYKWRFRALRELPELSGLAPLLETLLTTPNTPASVPEKEALIDRCAALVLRSLEAQGLTGESGDHLKHHAYSVNEGISDPGLRNEDLFYGV